MKLIEIDARWNDTQARFSAYAIIGTWDGTDDDDIFYYFDDKNIIGNHGDFTVLNFVELEIA
jgi:hypothetical protein